MSSGGKSRVPLGGFTSIFCTSPVVGPGVNAPDLPPPPPPPLSLGDSVAAASDKVERSLVLEVNEGLGMENLPVQLNVKDEGENL